LCAAVVLSLARSTSAYILPAANPFYYMQTNGPTAAISLGDWYGSNANGAAPGYTYLAINVPCGWPSNLPVQVDIQSPEMNTNPNAALYDQLGAAGGLTTTFEMYPITNTIVPGPTTPNLPAPGTGIPGSLVNYPAASVPLTTTGQSNVGPAEAWVRYHTIPTPV